MEKRLFITALAALFVLGSGVAEPLSAGKNPSVAGPVVVELFTSQGCGACPPANAYLEELAKQQDILALSWNVDYWDFKGWPDTLARPESSQRQRSYNKRLGQPGVYTPEMVVQGAHHLRGSDRAAVETLLVRIRREQPAPIDIDARRDGRAVSLRIADAGHGMPAASCDIVLVQYAFSKTVPIDAGDNEGLSVTYTNVVDKFETIGTWDGRAAEMQIDAGRLGKEGNVILLQDGTGGPILAAKVLAPSL